MVVDKHLPAEVKQLLADGVCDAEFGAAVKEYARPRAWALALSPTGQAI